MSNEAPTTGAAGQGVDGSDKSMTGLQVRQWFGLAMLALAIIGWISYCYFPTSCFATASSWRFTTLLVALFGLGLAVPYKVVTMYFFDPREWTPNDKAEHLVEKLRLRATLFNNISVVLLLASLAVIVVGIWLIVEPLGEHAGAVNPKLATDRLTIRISATVLMVFLVQVLFRVFRYLLRVAGFYHGIADSIELHVLSQPDTNTPKPQELEKLLPLLAPSAYDITELESTSVAEALAKVFKGQG